MKTIGQHTCKRDGGKEFVLKNAPFEAEYNKDRELMPFLGIGYYFWDYNISQARSWGQNHYNNSFYILQTDLVVPDEEYLDLSGNRQHMDYFCQLVKRFTERGLNANRWEIGTFIEFIKGLRQKEDDYTIFPFEIIRATDFNVKELENYVYKFNSTKSYTYLSPRFVICIFKLEHVHLQNKQIVF